MDSSKFGMELRHVALNFKSKKPERKSGAAYQAEYRERLKVNPQQWEEYKQRQKSYMSTYLNNLSGDQKKVRQERKTQRQRELRRAKQAAKKDSPSPHPNHIQKPKKVTRKSVQDSRSYWRERKRIQRASMTPVERAAINQRENERRRQKKSSTSLPSQQSASLPSQQSTELPSQQSTPTSFTTPLASSEASPTKSAKYSAVWRVNKTLPKSKKTKLFIMKQLINSCSPDTKKKLFRLSRSCQEEDSCEPPKQSAKKPRKKKHSAIKEKIVSFYDTVAVDIPDKRFYSKRLKKQRKVLNRPISLIYLDFVSKYPSCKVSKRNFFRCRPKHVLKMKSMKLRQCLCETCENMQLMFKPLCVAGSLSSVTDALNSTLCPFEGNWPSLKCVERKCNKCGTHLLQENLQAKCILTASVTYKYWDQVADERCKGKKTNLISRTCSMRDLISTFVSCMQVFTLHRFLDKWQRHQFNSLKSSLPTDCALIVLDYAENYTCQFQNQAQSAYYGLHQVTIHPVVIYTHCSHCLKKQTCYRVYISDDLKHDSHFVQYVLDDTLQSMNSNLHFIIFSDNCSSQYKSRLPVYHLGRLAQTYDFERCFFGERHGKSECDSSGGVVKSFLSQSVASCRATLTNAQDIFEYLQSQFQLSNENCSHCIRTFHLVENGAVDRSVTSTDVPLLKGIKKLHSFKFLREGKIATRQLSCFCPKCLSGLHIECASQNVPKFQESLWLTKNNTGVKRSKAKRMTKSKIAGCEDDSVDGGDIHKENTGVVIFEVGEDENPIEEECVGGDGNVDGAVAEEYVGGDGNVDGSDAIEKEFVGGDGNVDGGDAIEKEFVGGDGNIEGGDAVEEECVSGDGNLSEGEDCVNMKRPVKRQLFSKILTKSKSDKHLFLDFYHDLENCSSFLEMQALCSKQIFAPISIDPKPVKINLDTEALKIAPPNSPHGYLPNLTIGDGNCVARSLSTLVFGTENCHMQIRCRLIHELVSNKDLYLDPDFLSLGSDIDRSTIISQIVSVSDSPLDIPLSDTEQIFETEVFNTRLLGKCLGPWHLHAAAQILRCGIISLYPQLGPPQNRELLSRAFLPLSYQYEDPLFILWTSNRKDMKKTHWVANHVVPMVKMFK